MLKKHRKCLIDDPLWSVKNWLKVKNSMYIYVEVFTAHRNTHNLMEASGHHPSIAHTVAHEL